MPDTVPVTLEVEPDVAAALADPATRERVARLVSRAVRPAPSAEAHAAAGETLAAEFRAFRRGRSLGGLDPKALIREGLR
jgi:hypothetical protein